MNKEYGSRCILLPNMYVRAPLETDRSDQDYRDFGIGQVQSIDIASNTAIVKFYGLPEDEASEREFPLDDLDRTFILPQTSFTSQIGKYGQILYSCQLDWKQGELIEYHVLVAGEKKVQRLSEATLQVAANHQDYSPARQIQRYEFHNPIWKHPRDQFIECYNELHNATFGIEELVGARLMLLAHQAEVITRVLSNSTCRYILADEVGLGKTIEACVILKGLHRRAPQLCTLIIAPSSLIYQWHQELNTKFWLDFPIIQSAEQWPSQLPANGCIVSVESLTNEQGLRKTIQEQLWGLLIVDEAHHLYKSPELYKYIHQLSKEAKRVLVLSATPIQRYAQEYLNLLAIMDPYRYDIDQTEAFNALLHIQNKIRRNVTLLSRSLTKEKFDVEDFLDDIDPLLKALPHDPLLPSLVESVENCASNRVQSISAARESLAYVSENYRIEQRVIRNRRTHLKDLLAQRELDTKYSYEPGLEELETFDAIYDYINAYSERYSQYALCIEYCRVLLCAAMSSSHALLDVLERRIARLTIADYVPASPILNNILLPVAPRYEEHRIQLIVEWAPQLDDEYKQFLEPLLELTERWWSRTNQLLEESARQLDPSPHTSHKLLQTINAIHANFMRNPKTKIIVFSSWGQTLEALAFCLRQRYGKNTVVQFTCAYTDEELQNNADAFQSEKQCRILLCDELGGEGRNFQIADQIVHIDLPWLPTQVEQRIGRIDRLGRSGVVQSIVPYAQNTIEEDLFKLWQDAFELFTRSISGMEIALEGIQGELLNAFKSNPRRGLNELLSNMKNRAIKLREEVEEERYFEELSIDQVLRDDFKNIVNKYRDGQLLQNACLRWSKLAGISADYNKSEEKTIFNPKKFSIGAMKKAHFLQLPNMEEALKRSGRKNTLVVQGTFNRDIAVRREDLIFFAPGNDPWFDAIINNAIEADRGRCCAIFRSVPELQGEWRGFELRYSFSLDPRPLYRLGYDPSHLFRASGFLRTPNYHLLISEHGERESSGGLASKYTRKPFSAPGDIHLGKRDGPKNQIQHFKKEHPSDEWSIIVQRIFKKAEEILEEELHDYMGEVAEEAQTVFDKQAAGLLAAFRWRQQYISQRSSLMFQEIEEYKRISSALVEGLRNPIRRLESVCYWVLQGK